MRRYAALLGVVILLPAGFWPSVTVGFPGPPKDRRPGGELRAPADDGRAKFEALKKRLPGIVSAWAKTAWLTEPKLRLARRTSPTDAKIIFVARPAVRDDDSDCIFSLYLRYYDGAWTTMRWEAGGEVISQARVGTYMVKLALAVDESMGR